MKGNQRVRGSSPWRRTKAQVTEVAWVSSCLLRPFYVPLAGNRPRAVPSDPALHRPDRQASKPADLHVIVTVRHITSVRIIADLSDSALPQALSCQPSHRLEA